MRLHSPTKPREGTGLRIGILLVLTALISSSFLGLAGAGSGFSSPTTTQLHESSASLHSTSPVRLELPSSTSVSSAHSSARLSAASAAVPLSTGTYDNRDSSLAQPSTSTNPYYFQEGATFSQFDGTSISFTGWYINVTLVTSTNPIGYEFNGLTNTGDWYQVLVGYNWPGCNTGFEMLYSYWNNSGGNSGGTWCDSSVTLLSGNNVALDLYVDSTSTDSTYKDVCMEVYNWNSATDGLDCAAQPDPGSTPASNYFVTLGSSANAHGFFTGPMTEIVDTTAASCLTYSPPMVSYQWASSPSGNLYVTKYIPWSDEFQSGGSTCYINDDPVVSFAPGYHSTVYSQTDSALTYGSHWESATNVSTPSDIWNVITDDTPASPASSTLSESRSTADIGQTVQFSPSTSGGTAPYTYFWYLDGAYQTSTTVAWTYTTATTGTHTVVVYTESNGANMFGPSNTVTFTVYSDPTVGSPTASPASGGIDVGQSVTFTSATPSGGYGSYSYAWTSLPTGCTSTGASTDSCTPTAGSTYTVTVTVTDGNSYSVSGSISYLVYSDPSLSQPAPNRTSADVLQSVTFTTTPTGGTGVNTYTWTQTSSSFGCAVSTNSATISCVPTAAGSYTVSVYVVDSNGFTSTTATSATYQVYADPAVTAPSPSRSSVDATQVVTFSTTASLGTGSYSSYAWTPSGSGLGCSSSTTATISCTPSAAGSYSISVTVTDSNGRTSTVATLSSYTVYSDPTVAAPTASPASGGVDAGQSVTFTSATPSGGLAPFGFSWIVLPPGCANSNAATDTCTPSAASSVTIDLEVYDANGFHLNTTLSYTVDSDPAVSSLSANRATADVGQTVTYTASASGGSGVYTTYAWTASSGSFGCVASTTSTYSCTPTAAGTTYTVSVQVTDSNNFVSATLVSAAYTVFSDPAVSAPLANRTSADTGQMVSFSTSASLGTGTYTSYQWSASSANLGCAASTSSLLVCTVGSAGNYTVTVDVTDSNGFVSASKVSANFQVYSDPSVNSPSANPLSGGVDVGQNVTFTSAAAVGGLSPYSYSWTSLPTGCANTNSATDKCAPTAASTFTVSVKITDANSMSYTASISYTVDSDPSVTAPVANRSSADVGQAVSFSATPSGGSGGYGYSWSQSSSGLNCALANAATISCAPNAPGTTYTATVRVTDSNGYSVSHTSSAFTVYSDPTVSQPAPSRTTVDLGQVVSFSTSAASGTGSYTTYSWSESSSGLNCTLANAASISCIPTAAGTTYTVTVSVTDSNGFHSPSVTSVAYTVYTDPQVSLPMSNRSTADVGQSVTFSATASGGTGSYLTYTWSASSGNLGCTLANANSIVCVPVSSGTAYTVTITVKDSNGFVSAAATSAAFTVYADPTVSIPSPTPSSIDLNQSVSFSTLATLGTGSYTSYTWTESSTQLGCTLGTLSSITCHPTASGSAYTVSVLVVDSNGMSSVIASSTSFTVYADPHAGAPGLSPPAIDLGQSITLSATVTGGSGGFTYTWSGLPSGCPVSGSSVVCQPSSQGSWSVNFTVTDSNGVSSTSKNVTLTVNADPLGSFTPSTSQVNESGQTNNFTASASLGTVPYHYQWMVNGTAVSGATSKVFAFYPLHPATYQINVSITDAAGWVVWTSAVSESVSPGPQVTLTESRNAIDVGMSLIFNGSLTGGVGPYSWVYYLNGSQVQSGTLHDWNYTSLGAGNYNVTLTITDSIHAQVSAVVNFVVNPKPSGTVSPASPSVDLGQSQTLTVTPTGGTGPFLYQWYLNGTLITGATSSTYAFHPGGTASYLLNASVTDTFGLLGWSPAATLKVNADPVLLVSSPASVLDAGQTVVVNATVSLGTTPYACLWKVNGTAVAGATSCSSFSFTPTGPGTGWSVQASVTDGAGWVTNSSALSFTVHPALVLSASVSRGIGDANQTFVLSGTLSGGTPAYSCQWYVNNTPVSGATNCTSFSFTPSSAGSFGLELKVVDSVGGKANSSSVSVQVDPDPTLSLTIVTPEVDVGETANLTAAPAGGTPAYTCRWYLNGVLQSPSACSGLSFLTNATGTDAVNVTLVDGVGFVYRSVTVTVSAYAAPTISITPPAVTMDAGQTLAIRAAVSGGAPPVSCQWFVNSTRVSGAASCTSYSFSPSGAGTYLLAVAVSDSASPSKSARSANISILVYPALRLSVTPTSASTDVGGNISFALTAAGGSGNYTYVWYLNGSSIPGATSSKYVFVPTGAATYTLSGGVRDTANGSLTVPVTVRVNPQPSVTLSPSGARWLSLNQSLTINASVTGGSLPMARYVWTLNGSQVSSSSSAYTFVPSAVGTYSLILRVTDAAGVTVSSSPLQISVEDFSLSLVAASAVEQGLALAISATVSGGASPYAFAWYVNGVLQSGISGTNFLWTAGSSGNYSISATATDAHGVTGTHSFRVEVYSAVSVTLSGGRASIDAGQPLNFQATVSGGLGPYAYVWTLNGTTIPGATSASYGFTPKSPGTYSLEVRVSDSLGGTTNATKFTVSVTADPSVLLSASATSVTVGTAVSLTAKPQGGLAPYTVEWFLNGTQISGAAGTTLPYTPLGSGTYSFQAVVVDANGFRTASSLVNLTVSPVSHPTPGSKSPTTSWWWLLILLLVVIVALLVLVLIVRRRHSARRVSEETPSASSETEDSLSPAPPLEPGSGTLPPVESFAVSEVPPPPESEAPTGGPSETAGIEPMASTATSEVPPSVPEISPGPATPAPDPAVEPVPSEPPAAAEEVPFDVQVSEIERELREAEARGSPAPEETPLEAPPPPSDAPEEAVDPSLLNPSRRCFICGGRLEGDHCAACDMHWDSA